MKKYNILSSLFVAAVFGGCVSDYEPNYTGALSDKEISFKVSTANPSNAQAIVGQGTRATDLQDGFLEPIKAVSDYQKPLYLHTLISSVPDTSKQASRAIQYTGATDINSFGVLAYRYASSASATTPNFLYNSEFQKVGSKWSSVNKYYWPVNSDKLDFYAYAPYNNSAITLSAEDASGVPTMEFTVNPDASLQADLITAKALTQDLSAANTGVPLEFTHNLTTVKFILGADMLGTVTSITFKNIYTDGKLTFGGTWNFTGKTRGDISVPYNTNTYLIPQVFSDQAQEIQVVYNDGLQSYTLHYKLQGTSWTAGKAVTYCINSSAVTELKLGTIAIATNLSEMPKTTWADGDAVGLYAVESSTGTDKITNVKLTYSSSTGKWSLPANTTLLYTPKYEYYVYYPYQTAGLAHSSTAAAKPMASRATAASTYFASGISSWTIPTDQTNVATLNNADLQTSKGVVSASDAATLNFSLAHEMALCKVTLGTKQIPHTRTYQANSNTSYSDNYNVTVKAANNFNGSGGIKPYRKGTTDDFYAIVKPGNISTQQLKCASGIANGWANHPVTPNILKGNMGATTVQSDSTVIFMARAYSYTGNVQQISLPVTSYAKMECWGASGGNHATSGKGGFVSGVINITTPVTMYIYVGGIGILGSETNKKGGWNGGGNIYTEALTPDENYSGGGATDIRLTNGDWDNFNGLKTRIIVAGAGGGGIVYQQGKLPTYGGHAGGIVAPKNYSRIRDDLYIDGATQTSGSISIKPTMTGQTPGTDGQFGKGGIGGSWGGGGGGGYYGGAGGTNGPRRSNEAENRSGGEIAGGGGSSFISGHTGCNAISSSSTSTNIVHTGQPNHYSGYVFTNTIMKAGNESMPSPTGGTETGHTGNGYCKITWHPAL